MPGFLPQHESTEFPAKLVKGRLIYRNVGQNADFAV